VGTRPLSLSAFLLTKAHQELIGSLNPISDCRFKDIRVYIFQRFELNAISAYTRLAEFFSIGLG
jgi:hypothetical protein